MAISAEAVRYIKLGSGGRWANISLDRGELHFGYRKSPHELALAGNLDAMKQHLLGSGKDARSASREAREVYDFYELGSDCLWITFARDHLWWSFASPEVYWIGGDGQLMGERTRKTIGGWRNTDVNGVPLRTNTLSTRLTKVGNYRRAICKVEAAEYLMRRLNGLHEPFAEKSTAARDALLDVVSEGIRHLHQSDFETLIDMMFARSGFDARRDIAGIIVNRWGHAYLCGQPGFFFGTDGKIAPREVMRRAPFGKIAFANSDLSGIMDHRASIAESDRAVNQLLT